MSSDTAALVQLSDDVMQRVAAAIAVVTFVDPSGTRRGMTISSLAPVSSDPPSVLMCISGRSSKRKYFAEGQSLCVNVLAGDQSGHSMGFAFGEEDPFEVFDWSPAEDGTPVLAGTAAHLLCTVGHVVDHHGTGVVLADVTGGAVHKDDSLVYWRKRYFGGLVPVAGGEEGEW